MDNTLRGVVTAALTEQDIRHDPMADTEPLHTLLHKLGHCERCDGPAETDSDG